MAGRRYLLIIDDAYGRGRYPLITQMDDASGAVIGWALASFVMLTLLVLTLPRQLVGPYLWPCLGRLRFLWRLIAIWPVRFMPGWAVTTTLLCYLWVR